MQETTYVRTVALNRTNSTIIAQNIQDWIRRSSVFVQNEPTRIVVCYDNVATVINEGDVFSFTKNELNGKHYIVNHSEKRNTVRVKIGDNEFAVEAFTYKILGSTENMKFRLTCLNEPNLSGEFDDYVTLRNRLNEFLWEALDRGLLI